MIGFDRENGIIKIDTRHTTYAMQIVREKYVAHLYYGKTREDFSDCDWEKGASWTPYSPADGNMISLDSMPTELSFFGTGDLKDTAVKIQNGNGDCITFFAFADFRIYDGGVTAQCLPCSRGADETLELRYRDEVSGCELYSYYTVFKDSDTIVRKIKIVNNGNYPVSVQTLFSCQLDFASAEYDMLTLSGKYYAERHKQIMSLGIGRYSVYSKRGHSSHAHNPFVALVSKRVKENAGETYGAAFSYSGDFEMQTERLANGFMRLLCGFNRDTFGWKLNCGEEIFSPETVLTYSACGLNGMSQNLHDHIRAHILPEKFACALRPVLINTWEAAYFDIDENILLRYAERATQLGIDTLVMDDGWFGKRYNDRAGLGDWYVNREKFPDGLAAFATKIRAAGVKFGIWIEPEMVNPNSDLFRTHPDWALGCASREKSLSRNQLVLDLTNPEVVDYVAASVTAALSEVNPDYIKWDFNRSLTEVGSHYLPRDRQSETAHRFVLGSYRLHEKITRAFPDTVFEGCAGGGGRFDLGILRYVPQIWTSDQTDPVCRLPIQYGTSIAYPLSTMTAHVSDALYNKSENEPDYDFRFAVALWGITGYELNITRLSQQECDAFCRQTALLRKLQPLILNGDLYRIDGLYKTEYAFTVISKDKTEFLFDYVSIGLARHDRVSIAGLKENALYADECENRYTGAELMRDGLPVSCKNKEKYAYSVRHFIMR